MLIVVYQSIFLRPYLSSLLVFLIFVCCVHCCPLPSLSFVLVAVRHPPCLRRVESHSSQHNVDCCVLTLVLRPCLSSSPLLSTPLYSSPLHSSPLLFTPLHSSPLHSSPLLSSPLRSNPLLSSLNK